MTFLTSPPNLLHNYELFKRPFSTLCMHGYNYRQTILKSSTMELRGIIMDYVFDGKYETGETDLGPYVESLQALCRGVTPWGPSLIP